MPKGGFLTPKAIGNRIKAKGLQKLRWYCEMCQKQCRDENGFKCHQTSEGHLRQMRIFAENPQKVMERYSLEFEELFLDTLQRHHNTKRCHANQVYKEYIADKHHVHMNSTKYATLTDFIMYLGKTGKCVVDETEKGWFISWIDRDPAVIARQEAADKKRRSDMDDEARRMREVERRVKAAHGEEDAEAEAEATELQRAAGDKVEFKMSSSSSSSNGGLPQAKKAKVAGVFGSSSSSSSSSSAPAVAKLSAMESMMKQELQRKLAVAAKETAAQAKPVSSSSSSSSSSSQSEGRKDYWLWPGLVVKVLNKKVGGGRFYKSKGTVVEVIERYVAVVRVMDDTTGKTSKLQLDQEDLETVIPKVGGAVRVVNGRGRGCAAQVLAINTDQFCVAVRVSGEGQPLPHGTVLDKVEYEDVCKLEPEVKG